jgi:ATP synthase protein I
VPAPGPIVRYAKYGALAFEFSGTIAASAALGWLIDDWLGTAPWGIVGATLLGVIGGFVRLVELARRFERRDREA